MRLIVIHPNRIKKSIRSCGHWVYVDNSPFEYERLRGCFRTASALFSQGEFHELVARNRDQFISWFNAVTLNRPSDDSLSLAYGRNPCARFLAHALWLAEIARAIKKVDVDELYVVTRSYGVAKTLKSYAGKNQLIFTQFGTFEFLCTLVKERMLSVLKLSFQIGTMVARIILSRVWLGSKYRTRLHDAHLEVIVDTYLLSGDVTEDGVVTHRYYPLLLEWYHSRRKSAAYMPILHGISIKKLVALYKGYKRCNVLFVPHELYLRCSDLFDALIRCWRKLNKRDLDLPPYGKVDLTPLLKVLHFGEVLGNFEPELFQISPLRLMEAGFQPRLIIDWFENQAYDRALFAGCKKAWPTARFVAARQYTFMENDLGLFVINAEVSRGDVPQEHWLCGRYWLNVASKYDSLGVYHVTPALRYTWLHTIVRPSSEGKEALVLLTHSVTESLCILSCLDAALDEILPYFEIIRIKPHPAASASRLHKILNRGGKHRLFKSPSIIWSEVHLAEQSHGIRMAIGTGTGATLEVVCLGIPIIQIEMTLGLDVSPLEFVDKRLWVKVRDGNELVRAVKKWSPKHPLSYDYRIKIGSSLLLACFEPATSESMGAFNFE